MCPEKQCMNSTAETISSIQNQCKCDLQCQFFGDCCADAPTANQLSFSSLPDPGNCTSVPSVSSTIYIQNTCSMPKSQMYDWKKCRASTNYTEQVPNTIVKIPVTDPSTGITYGNFFCARCQNVNTFVYWYLHLQCQTANDIIPIYKDDTRIKNFLENRTDLQGKLTFNYAFQLWQLTNNFNNRTENCSLTPMLPNKANITVRVRECNPNTMPANLVSNCTQNGTLPNECPGFLAVVKHRSKEIFYRNKFCARCNNVSNDNVDCVGLSNLTKTRTRLSTISLQNETTTLASSSTGISLPKNKPNKKRAYMYIQMNKDCNSALQILTFSKVIAETVYYATMNRTFVKNRTEIPGSIIRICDMSRKPTEAELERDKEIYSYGYKLYVYVFMWIVYTFLTAFPCILYSMYLCKYLSPKTSCKTFYEKALIGFVLALFLLYGGTLSQMWYIVDLFGYRSVYCIFTYYLEYYGFLTTLCWSVALAFETMCTIWNIGVGDKTKDKEETGIRFTVYSWLSWVGPGIIAASKYWTSTYTDPYLCSYMAEPESFMLYFYAFPIIVSMSMNLAFYACSLYVIRTQTGIIRKLSKVHGIDFSLYTGSTVCATIMCIIVLSEEESFIIPLWVVYCVFSCLLAFSVYFQSPIQNELFIKLKNYARKYSSWFVFVNEDDK